MYFHSYFSTETTYHGPQILFANGSCREGELRNAETLGVPMPAPKRKL